MNRYKVIVNPISGRGAGERLLPRVEQLLRDCGLNYDLIQTEYRGHAIELTQEAIKSDYNIVVAMGGDGTANEVLNGIMQAKLLGIKGVALGILSVGSGNDFAFSMGVPHDLAAGCQVLAANHRRWIDVGRATGGDYPQGRYFGNGVGIGFDAVVGFEALKLKHVRGFLAYIVAALKTIFLYNQAPLVRIEFADQTLLQHSLMISIMNGRRLGGGFMVAPNGIPDDGLFDLCIADQVSRLRIFGLVPKFMKGTHISHEAIHTDRIRRIVATAVEGTLPAHADGETLCTTGEQLTIELLPRQIEILCRMPQTEN